MGSISRYDLLIFKDSLIMVILIIYSKDLLIEKTYRVLKSSKYQCYSNKSNPKTNNLKGSIQKIFNQKMN